MRWGEHGREIRRLVIYVFFLYLGGVNHFDAGKSFLDSLNVLNEFPKKLIYLQYLVRTNR